MSVRLYVDLRSCWSDLIVKFIVQITFSSVSIRHIIDSLNFMIKRKSNTNLAVHEAQIDFFSDFLKTDSRYKTILII
jgi:hypothetical protein